MGMRREPREEGGQEKRKKTKAFFGTDYADFTD
jgi:hypothetical protein